MNFSNETFDNYDYYDYYYFWMYFYGENSTVSNVDVGQLNYKCRTYDVSTVWVALKILIILTALPANIVVLWLLLSGKMGKLTSQALGFSLALMDLIYCIFLPLDIYTSFQKLSEQLFSFSEALSIINLIGCPLMVTAMCFERCIAVVWPVMYLSLKESKYRWVVSALVMVLTVSMALLAYFIGIINMSWPLTVGVSVLFFLMLLCLGGIVFILCKKGPSDNERERPQKRRALNNVLILLCPFTVAYLPILALIPFQSLVIAKKQRMDATNCMIFQTFISFPNFGVYIDPMFYLPRIKHILCQRRVGSGQEQTEGISRSSFVANHNITTTSPAS